MGKIAFLFAGQGAQYAGMAKSLYESSSAARTILDEAERLRPGTLELCFTGTKEQLSLTENTQPCLMAVDCACDAALREAGVRPDGLAGFSLGELAALASGGMLPFREAFTLTVTRAELMARCARRFDSGMIAVLRLPDDTVEAICRETNAYPVNYNCPGQVVCALLKSDFPAFTEAVQAAGGRALPLAVGGGFHSPFMREAAEGLRAYADTLTFRDSAVPLYANATNRPYTAAQAAALLSAQVESPVRWAELIRLMQADGYTAFVELGAGKTLGGLMAKIGGAQIVAHVEDAESLAETFAML
ncbi:MAG: ACP S-malonyltransferase [Eubacteriales bacterium]|nr:ACP S-malonyltransferase [Eubacteriales bacterium]